MEHQPPQRSEVRLWVDQHLEVLRHIIRDLISLDSVVQKETIRLDLAYLIAECIDPFDPSQMVCSVEEEMSIGSLEISAIAWCDIALTKLVSKALTRRIVESKLVKHASLSRTEVQFVRDKIDETVRHTQEWSRILRNLAGSYTVSREHIWIALESSRNFSLPPERVRLLEMLDVTRMVVDSNGILTEPHSRHVRPFENPIDARIRILNSPQLR